MRSFLFIPVLAATCFSMHAQSFAIKTDFTYGLPRLWKMKGETTGANFYYTSRWAPSVGAEYQFSSGFMLTGTLSYQKDKFFMHEDPFEYQAVLSFVKKYTSVALNAGAGYSHPLGSTHWSVFGLASVGAGWVKSKHVTNTFDMEGETVVVTNQSSFVDTVQIHYSVADRDVNAVKVKFDCSAGLEYKWEHLFCRAYAGMQLWTSPFSEVQYHASHASEHYNMQRTSDGDFSVTPGYLTWGVGLGWRFGSSEL